MPALLNGKHEAFCQAYVRGPHAGNAAASYEAAGYHAHTSNAARLAGAPHIQARIAELMEEGAASSAAAAEAHGVTHASVIGEMKKIAFANFADYVRVNDDGDIEPDLVRLNRDQAAAIREFTVDYFDSPEGARRMRRLRIRMNDKRLALADLARCLGMFVNRRNDPADAAADAKRDDLSNVTLEQQLVAAFAELAADKVDLRDLLDRAIAAGEVKLAPDARPLRDHPTLAGEIARCAGAAAVLPQ